MKVSVLIPTCDRLNALIATLTSLTAQTFRDFEVIISDQSKSFAGDDQVIQTISRLLKLHDNPVTILHNLPKNGIAHQRQFLLEQSSGKYSLFIDDDVIIERDVMARMVDALTTEPVGFCGMALIGLSYLNQVRPNEQKIEFWSGDVLPEVVRPGTKEWDRYPLHNAANIYHVSKKLNVTEKKPKRYKIGWVGGCVLYDTNKLRETGGFTFWRDLPAEHCGEDVMAQLKLMERYGGFGILPSGAYHLELPTTIVNREINAPEYLLRQQH
ncbi:MAG TPA: glycosyltransferase family A protein [Daejeonella sp.]